MRNLQRRRRPGRGLAVIAGCVSLLTGAGLAGGVTPGRAASPTAPVRVTAHAAAGHGCQLRNGVKHVIEIVFDNVHFSPTFAMFARPDHYLYPGPTKCAGSCV